ncbi:hypothetical protein HRbin29_00409 [bacterium HR29]|jgi:hypothetical protein|nr:hypothetical protein HRbin29_00409 [bacterium HR29]
MRIAPPRVTAQPSPAPRPPAGAPEADAFRQTAFVLGQEVEAVLDLLALEGACAEASSAAKYRKPATALALALWSQSWLCRLDALHAIQWGRYAAAPVLVRAAADAQAAMEAVLAAGDDATTEWSARAIALRPEVHALEVRLEPARSGETLARNEELGEVYRQATALAVPSFAAALLLEGGDTNTERIAVAFGERTFHLGLAELQLGWLLHLSLCQVAAAEGTGRFAPFDAERRAAAESAARATLAREDRCRMERILHGDTERWLVRNWRRLPGAAPKRFLL